MEKIQCFICTDLLKKSLSAQDHTADLFSGMVMYPYKDRTLVIGVMSVIPEAG